MSDVWAWWRKALENPASIGKGELAIHEGHPQAGYYRSRNRDKTFDPVAIYQPEGSDTMVALRGNREVDPDAVWTWCCRYPVTYEAYIAAVDGKGWPDDDATVADQVATVGDNSGDVSEVETLKDQIDNALAGVDKYASITDDETASKALSLRNRLNELSGEADKKREAEKRPHLDAGKKVDATWQPLVKGAKAGADKVRDAIAKWETAKLAEQRKREREEEAARIAAEQARIATQKAEDAGLQPAATNVPEPPAAPASDACSAKITATYGKAASVTAVMVLDEVTDWAALSAYMLNHPEMRELLMKLAQRAIAAGRTVPGVTVKEEVKVR